VSTAGAVVLGVLRFVVRERVCPKPLAGSRTKKATVMIANLFMFPPVGN
jgi:hypothetical protein